MDGASRFTQRDAMASILITSINIVAGFLIGVLQHGMDLERAIETYTVLTIGDGLVTVVPALMISVSGGLIVTRASSDNRLGADFKARSSAMAAPGIAAGCLMALAAFPGLPKIPFLVLGFGLGTIAGECKKRRRPSGRGGNRLAGGASQGKRGRLLEVERLSIDVGLGLVKLVEGGADSPLLRRVSAVRRQLATDLGYVLPAVRFTDNLALKSHEYAVCSRASRLHA